MLRMRYIVLIFVVVGIAVYLFSPRYTTQEEEPSPFMKYVTNQQGARPVTKDVIYLPKGEKLISAMANRDGVVTYTSRPKKMGEEEPDSYTVHVTLNGKEHHQVTFQER